MPLIYKSFLGAWLSVNQGFSAQNLGHCLSLFFLVTTRLIARLMAESKLQASISKTSLPVRDQTQFFI
jgi:hypothetical protein